MLHFIFGPTIDSNNETKEVKEKKNISPKKHLFNRNYKTYIFTQNKYELR